MGNEYIFSFSAEELESVTSMHMEAHSEKTVNDGILITQG